MPTDSAPQTRGRLSRQTRPVSRCVTAVASIIGILAASNVSATQVAATSEAAPDVSGTSEPGSSATEQTGGPAVEPSRTHAPDNTNAKPVAPKSDLFRLRPTRNMVEIGVYTGTLVTTEDHELYDYNSDWERYRPGVAIGVRGGFYPLGSVGIEGEAGVSPLRTGSGQRATLYNVRGHAVAQLPLYSVAPFAVFGGGVVGTTGAQGSDVDPALHFGGGIKVFMNRWFGFRVEGRGLIMPAHTREANRTIHGEFLFNVIITLNRRFIDTDGDGFPDPGQRSKREDACPMIPGISALRGCPDLDRDGLTDSKDVCPSEPGPKERQGCPGLLDSDHDGFFDPRQHAIPDGKEDACPGVAGVPEYAGCPVPDTDGDGLDDLHDACIEQPENINGYEDEDGCPDSVPLPVRKILGTIQGIHFNFLSAALTEDSKPIIGRAATVLAEYPELRLEIQGHTDSDGDPAFNHELSRKRAESVRSELIKSGVDKARINAVGYGGTKPKASNETEEGRATNRRIEFRLLDKNGRALEVDRGENE